MSRTIEVRRDDLYAVYSQIKDALGKLELLVADLGCLHPDAIDVTTMDGSNVRRSLCPDCGATIEEEIKYDELER